MRTILLRFVAPSGMAREFSDHHEYTFHEWSYGPSDLLRFPEQLTCSVTALAIYQRPSTRLLAFTTHAGNFVSGTVFVYCHLWSTFGPSFTHEVPRNSSALRLGLGSAKHCSSFTGRGALEVMPAIEVEGQGE